MVLSRPRRRRRCVTILGTKIRAFAPLPNLSLEELVPKDNFYRRLEATLDLSFARELVRDCYAPVGRPSVDPVVFFEGLRSERQLMEVVHAPILGACEDYDSGPVEEAGCIP